MRKTILALMLALWALLTACMPQRPSYADTPPVSQAPPSFAETPAASGALSPQSTESGIAALPEDYIEAEYVGDPSELALDGSLSWMWENPLTEPSGVAAMYSMCAAVTGKDENGRDCVYAGQVYRFGEKPIYTAGEDYPNINSVSGSKFSVYFIEHNDTKWRLVYLPLDSDPDQAEVIDQGEGLIPVLSPYTETTLAYAVQTGNTYAIRVREKKWDDNPAELLGDIPLDGAPLEPAHAYFHDVYAGVAYSAETANGYAIVTHDIEGSPISLRTEDRPVNPQANETGIAWMDETGRLFFWLRGADRTFLLGEGVAWYTLNFGILFADQNASRLVYAQPLADGENFPAEMGCISLSQGSWRYLDGNLFSLGENYACVLRERDGAAQFAGMELTLLRGE